MCNEISCCFTGHRPDHLPWGREEGHPDCEAFYLRLTQATEEKIGLGCRIFYSGMAQGVDMMAAQIVLGLRAAHPEWGLELIAVCPHEHQAARWSQEDRKLYHLLLDLADQVVVLEKDYTPYCYHQRNRYMVDHCAHMIAGFDGISKGGTSSTVQYARRKGREILEVSPYKMGTVMP